MAVLFYGEEGLATCAAATCAWAFAFTAVTAAATVSTTVSTTVAASLIRALSVPAATPGGAVPSASAAGFDPEISQLVADVFAVFLGEAVEVDVAERDGFAGGRVDHGWGVFG